MYNVNKGKFWVQSGHHSWYQTSQTKVLLIWSVENKTASQYKYSESFVFLKKFFSRSRFLFVYAANAQPWLSDLMKWLLWSLEFPRFHAYLEQIHII